MIQVATDLQEVQFDRCDKCRIKLRRTEFTDIGEKNGQREVSWWKLCNDCYERIYKTYVIPTLDLNDSGKSLGKHGDDIGQRLWKHSERLK